MMRPGLLGGVVAALLAALLVACAGPGRRGAEDTADLRERLAFVGAEAVGEQELLGALEEDLEYMRRYGLDKAAADDAAYGLREHYRSRGHPLARVEYAYSPLDGGSVEFLIEEGPRMRIGEVLVEGVHDLAWRDIETVEGPRDLERFFKPVRRNLFGRRRPVWFVLATLEKARDELRQFLQAAGYLDAEVLPLEESFDEERARVDLRVTVRPGRRYTLGAVGFRHEALVAAGSSATPVPATEAPPPERRRAGEQRVGELLVELEALLPSMLGDAYSPQTPWTLRARVIDVFRRRGHPDCLVTFEVDRTRSQVALVYLVDPGPRVTIGEVRMEGFVETRLPFARARVGIEPGTQYDSSKVRRAFRSLYRTGIFESVSIELEETEGEERDLAVNVVEAPGREVFVEPGYGSYERLRVLVGGKERNLFGTGKVLGIEGKLGEKAQGGKLTLTDPWFLDQDLVATYGFFANRREEPSFTRREVGITTAVTEEWSNRLSTTLGYQYRKTLLSDVVVDDAEARDALLDVDISSVALTVTWDGRDDVFVPTSGLRTRSILEWGGEEIGSELDFTRATFELSHFTPLDEGRVLGAGLGLGAIWPLGGTGVIPLQERFFNGGEDSVRSYREDELGPRDADGTPLGGEAFTFASLELRQRLVGNLEGAFFVDTGHVSERAADVFSGKDYGWGVGVGLRYLLPIGPMRLDGAFNPDAGPDEDDFVLHFAVGMSF